MQTLPTTINTENSSLSPNVPLCPFVVSVLLPARQALIYFLSLSISFVCSRTAYKSIHMYVIFGVWLFMLSIIFLRFIHAVDFSSFFSFPRIVPS